MLAERTILKQQIHLLLRGSASVNFEELAIEIFAYQYQNNALYHQFCNLLKKNLSNVTNFYEIPFLPIQFFKNYAIQTNEWQPETIFRSSGTTGMMQSQHLVRETKFYTEITDFGFQKFYGDAQDWCILALLPSYLEREGSSLILMVEDFIQKSSYPQSGFFLRNHGDLVKILLKNKQNNIPTLLLGVSFALLDLGEYLAQQHLAIGFPNLVVMETGGMKGRRRELTRGELHKQIKENFYIKNVHSEYGMTELFSQAYARQDGIFEPIPTLKAFARMTTDPLSIEHEAGRLGVLNLIDLANLDTIAFIATDDLGRVFSDGTFEVLGRLDNADLRGCNLLVAE